jgi:hypothetical protein
VGEGGAVVVVIATVGGAVGARVSFGAAAARVVGGGLDGWAVVGALDETVGNVDGAEPEVSALPAVVTVTERDWVDDVLANGATARSTPRGDTMAPSLVVMRVSTRSTAAHASPLVTVVPRMHAPRATIRVRTTPLSSPSMRSRSFHISNHS